MQDGTINDEVDITEVRKYVWYTETNGNEYKEDIQEKSIFLVRIMKQPIIFIMKR